MTYCCGILVRDGLVMIADTRTNAGLDNISTFRKLHVYSEPGERIMALASSGNLSLSQTVRSTLTEGVDNPETGERETLLNSPTMFQDAQRIGRTIRGIQNAEGKALEAAGAAESGLVTFTPDEIDWEDEVRIGLEARAAFSPDALTGMEASLRFAGPETLETKIFARLSAWQNWIFQRPNAVGPTGALHVYGTGRRSEFDRRRV